MGSRTIYNCDYCNKDVSSKSDLTLVQIAVHEENRSVHYPSYSWNMCKDCLIELGYIKTEIYQFTNMKQSNWKKFIANIFKKEGDK